jgi:hypothetical protein
MVEEILNPPEWCIFYKKHNGGVHFASSWKMIARVYFFTIFIPKISKMMVFGPL